MSENRNARNQQGQTELPPPGRRKRDPQELEKIHDKAVEDSMIASDPPSTIMPEVKKNPDRNKQH